MNEILRLALVAAQTVATANAPPPPRARPFFVVIAVMTIVICVLIASGFILTGLWIFLLPYLGPVGTPLVLGGVLLLKAGVFLLLLRIHPARAVTTTAAPVSLRQLAPVVAEAEQLFSDHKLTALTAALLAGLVVGTRRA